MEIFIISLVAFLAALLTFFSGFGLGTILTPVMMIFFPVDVAIAFTGIVHFSNNIFKLFIVGQKADKKILIRFGIPAVFAAFLGSYVLINMDTDYVMYSYNLMGELQSISYVKFLISLLLMVFALIDLKNNYNINNTLFKEHPLNNYEGIEDSRDWMFDSHENVKSFFSYWKKCKKELKIKNLI